MQNIKKDIWIGLFVLSSFVILFGTFIIHKGLNPYSRKVSVTFSSVLNITKGTKVNYKGYDVGIINNILFKQDQQNAKDYFELELLLKKDFALYEGVQFEIQGLGLMGTNYMNVILPEKRDKVLEGVITIAGTENDAGGLDIGAMMNNMNKAMKSVFEADLEGKLGEMVAQVEKVSSLAQNIVVQLNGTLRKVDKTIDKTSVQIDGVLAELSTSLDALSQIVSSVKEMMGSSEDEGVQKIVASLEEITDKMLLLTNNSSNLMDKHVDDISEMMVNLKDAVISLNYLSKHPRKFLFGGKVKGLKDKGEEKK